MEKSKITSELLSAFEEKYVPISLPVKIFNDVEEQLKTLTSYHDQLNYWLGSKGLRKLFLDSGFGDIYGDWYRFVRVEKPVKVSTPLRSKLTRPTGVN